MARLSQWGTATSSSVTLWRYLERQAEKAVCVALHGARGTFSTTRRNGLQRACPTSAAAAAAVVGKTAGRLCVVDKDVLSRQGVG